MENEILEVEKQRQEIIKRIQEKERLINLIKNRHVKGDMNEIKEFQKKYNETKLEKPSELIKQESNKDLNEIIPNENNEELVDG